MQTRKLINVMKSIRRISNRQWLNFRLPAVLVAVLAWTCSLAQTQTTFHVGGQGVIGTSTLTTVVQGANHVATLPVSGGQWAAAGGEGVLYSTLSSPTLTVAHNGPATLKFTHRYNFEPDWDGGAVFVTVNGSGPTYVSGSAFTTNGYDRAVAGSSVWTGGGASIQRPISGLGHINAYSKRCQSRHLERRRHGYRGFQRGLGRRLFRAGPELGDRDGRGA